jgi:hypothetical protein
MPVEQDHFRHPGIADIERLLAILRLDNLEIEVGHDAVRNLANDLGVLDDETLFHAHDPIGAPLCGVRLQSRKADIPSLAGECA